MVQRHFGRISARKAPGRATLVAALSLFAAACGGDSQDSGKSKAELEMQMLQEVENLNSCNVVDDCQAVHLPFSCASYFIGKDADHSTLDALIEDYAGDPIACVASCQCGLLSCQAGRCQADPGDCMEPPNDTQQMVCL